MCILERSLTLQSLKNFKSKCFFFLRIMEQMKFKLNILRIFLFKKNGGQHIFVKIKGVFILFGLSLESSSDNKLKNIFLWISVIIIQKYCQKCTTKNRLHSYHPLIYESMRIKLITKNMDNWILCGSYYLQENCSDYLT